MTSPYSAPNSALFTLEEERVVVLGAGRSGVAAANLAAQRGAKVRLYESRAIEPIDNLDTAVELITGATPEIGRSVYCDYLVLSPGIAAEGELASAFAQQAGERIGELELASRYYTGTLIAITGTNGKTTTTELTAHLLNAAGREALPCGNHGQPLSELLLKGAPEIAVVEVSSFQLETTVTFRPQISVWTNFAPDHLDRYPDLEAYRRAKLRLFEGLHPTDWKITKEEDGLEFPYNHLTFSAWSETADYTLEGQQVHGPDGDTIDLSASRMRGRHNSENTLAAIAAVQCLGLDLSFLPEALSTFEPPAHRCEFVATVAGVDYINDSKSTNLHSLQTALRSFPQDLILIIGGKEKGLDFQELVDYLAKNVKHVLTIGEIGEKLVDLLRSSAPTTYCGTLEKALAEACKIAQRGTVVLFSPGTSSFDQYESYEARGEAFQKSVASLPEPSLPSSS